MHFVKLVLKGMLIEGLFCNVNEPLLVSIVERLQI